jgi:CRISP-associated protein Cas1
MIKRTIDISNGPTRLKIEHDQLVIIREDQEVGRVPCEDIGVLLVDQQATTYTHSVLTRLVEHGGVVVLCGQDHLPCGLVLPMNANELVTQRQRLQLDCSQPTKKRLWQQIVKAKIAAQARNVPIGSEVRDRLLELSKRVRSGDPENLEAQAARFYWPAFFGDGFRREQGGAWPNPLLNYGYMVMRAAVARALAGAGLNPCFGLHHSNRGNAFCLADDLVELLRPLVDREVYPLLSSEKNEITQDNKRILLNLLAEEVKLGDVSGPLMVQLHRLASSLVDCYQGSREELEIPIYPGAIKSIQMITEQPKIVVG